MRHCRFNRCTKLNIICAFLVFFCLAGGFGLINSVVFADDSIDANVSLSIPMACTMTGTVDTPHTATVDAGTYRTDIGTTTLKTVCNDGAGFSIYAIGYSNQEYGNNKLLATVGGTLSPSNNIATGTATSGSTSNWAMKLKAGTGSYQSTIVNGYDNYSNVPTVYTKVATRLASTDLTTGSNLQTTYAAYVTSSQSTGTYNGKVKYTLVHPNDADTPLQPYTTQAGQICYYPNGGNVEGTMGCQTIPTSGTVDDVTPTSAILLASNFSRTGYGFAGWSKTFDYSDDTGFLGPQEDITFTAGEYSGNNNGLSLYARWIKSAGSLQNWTGCSSLASGAVTALTDQRDNETYAIVKLADGNCWMIENLRLESTAEHNSDGALAQGYDASFAGLADPEVPWANNSTTANSLYSTDGSTDKTISGSNQGYRFPRYSNINTPVNSVDRPQNPTRNTFAEDGNTVGMYSYGNYYTWAAAIASTDDYSTGDYNSTSICPAGWHIPTGGNDTGEFYALNVAVNGVNNENASGGLRAYPNNFIYSGQLGNFNVSSRGLYGLYWSSSSQYRGFVGYLGLGKTVVTPGAFPGFIDVYFGHSIRCIMSTA